MKAFVTGGTGFLGLNVIGELVARGWEVCAICRPSSDTTYLRKWPVHLHQAAVEDKESLLAAMPQAVDAVFHIAGNKSFWRRHAEEQFNTNVEGTRNVADVALQTGAKRFIFTSSIGAYGMHPERITEQTIPNALDSGIGYSRTKALAEMAVRERIEMGLDAVILNPSNVIGPYERGNILDLFRSVRDRKLPATPTGGSSFCDSRELARIHLEAFFHGRTGQNYLIGGVDISYRELMQRMADLLRVPAPRFTASSFAMKLYSIYSSIPSLLTGTPPKITLQAGQCLSAQMLCDDSLAQKELGLVAVPIEVMLRDYYSWARAEALL